MKKISKKSFIFLSALFSFLVLSGFLLLAGEIFAQRQLEVTYPSIQGFSPETASTSLPGYVKYIFNFTILIVGLIGFAVLILAGVIYLTSAGNVEKLKNAKKQIRAALLGILILLFSYLILTTINPQLVIFRELTIKPAPEAPALPEVIISATPSSDILERIKELAQAIKNALDAIDNTAKETKSLTDKCDCSTTKPMCLCKKYLLGSCSASYCYSAASTQPCPDSQKIKDGQQKIVDLRDLILYYKNRASAEAVDLKENIEKILNVIIKWYEDKIKKEKEVSDELGEGSEKDLEQVIISNLEQEKNLLDREKGCKEELRKKLDELASTTEKIKEPINNLIPLPDQCLTNVKERCTGSCSGGCHNTTGCFPSNCSGGNPCPASEITSQINKTSSTVQEIKKIADEIIQLQEKVREKEICPSTGTTPTTTPATSTCQMPQELAQQNKEPYPAKRAASLETLLTCISSQTGQSLPAENGSNQFYGSLYTYEHTNVLCNYTRGKTTCGKCAHIFTSCHYGGVTGQNGALAVDLGNEKNADKIIQAALKCGAKNGRCENSSGTTVNCSDYSAHHIHINDKNCDRN